MKTVSDPTVLTQESMIQKEVSITSRRFASAFGTYSVEPSGPSVTLRGKASCAFGIICWMVGAAGLLTSKIATLAVQFSGCATHSLLRLKRLEFATASRVSLL